MAYGETYEEFVAKFQRAPEKTTDDCITPPLVYGAVADWVAERYGLDPLTFVRPFYPGGDFENYNYPDGCTVVDNPPFSIFSKIVDFYCDRKIPFFLFAPGLTAFSILRREDVCVIVAGITMTYDNGAGVETAFVTNLEPEYVAIAAPTLRKRLKTAEKQTVQERKPIKPKMDYPSSVMTYGRLSSLARRGVDCKLKHSEVAHIWALDEQRAAKKSIYGAGLLISRAAEARYEAAKKQTVMEWHLSDREENLRDELD